MFKDDFTTVARAHHLSLKTERAYWHHARAFIKWTGAKSAKALADSATERFRAYLSMMANVDERQHGNEGYSASHQNQAFHALRFLFEKVVGVELGDLSGIPRVTRAARIVDVPPDDVARELVGSIPGKCGLAIRTIYGTAGRLNDVLRVRVKDLDFHRKLIAFQESKGGKSRLVPMPPSLVVELKELAEERKRIHKDDLAGGFGWVSLPGRLAGKYPGEPRSIGWQFVFCAADVSRDPVTGNYGRHHLLEGTLQKAMMNARRRRKVWRRYTIHSLRHACAQWWERNGVTRSEIQKLLGHKDSATTDTYLLSGRNGVPKAPSPI